MIRKNYFEDYVTGEAYVYGLKCVSPTYIDDVREVIHVAPHSHKKHFIKIDRHSRRMYKIILEEGATAEVDCVLIAGKDIVTDVYVEIIHLGSISNSHLTIHGYTKENGRIICRFVTEVPQESSGCTAMQKALFYEFGTQGSIDCIPELSIANKDVQSSHSIACERINDEEYWFSATRGLRENEYMQVVEKSLSVLV